MGHAACRMQLSVRDNSHCPWCRTCTIANLDEDGFNTPRKGKNNDKAHPPIHPTAHAGNLAGDEKRVYEYITRRYLGCCSKDAEGWQTTVDVVCGGEEFYATGVLQTNWVIG
jgi:DNA topoisomerase-3